ncbi:hypothetical protein [Burkholderia gladioli]|uniref:Transmembrane protein n=1 Tax=Burkholderia gladioli (strain BSR3) TaxID=999541 RepID=F2LCJ2_BURGS|nr:hypothetical protein [Burkholderia gladioli]AEA60525.1 hypothetical protein bgla_1g18850 [Burkholderia gladioli BSR3]
MKKFGLLTLNIVVTLLGGWILAHIIVAMTDDMPEWLESALTVALHATGQDQLANPVDLPALGMLAILVASIIVCGLLVWIANTAIARARTRRAQA